MIISDIESDFDQCSHALISHIILHMGFDNNFVNKLQKPYHLANAIILFNNIELQTIPVTSGTDQCNPLSRVAFMISAFHILIKIQTINHIYLYIHKLKLVHDNDPIFKD